MDYFSKMIPFHEKDRVETDVVLAEMSMRETMPPEPKSRRQLGMDE